MPGAKVSSKTLLLLMNLGNAILSVPVLPGTPYVWGLWYEFRYVVCIYINLWYVGIGVVGRLVWIMICFEAPIWVVSKS